MLNKLSSNTSYAAKERLVNKFCQIHLHILIARLNTQMISVPIAQGYKG